MHVPALLELAHGGEGSVHRARHALASALFRVYTLTGERPSPAVVAYFRPYVECEQRYEEAVLRRLDSLAPLPGTSPLPSIRRLDAPAQVPLIPASVARPRRRVRPRAVEVAPIG